MADTLTPEKRSWNMSRIRSSDTGPEEYVRKLLHHRGYRYRKNDKRITGRPDIWLPRYRTAVFVHGCYWHRHPGCKMAYTPKSKVEFWQKKFSDNVARDQEVKKSLLDQNIRILTIWECTTRKAKKDPVAETALVRQIEDFLNRADDSMEL